MSKKLPSILLGGAVIAVTNTLLGMFVLHFALKQSPLAVLISYLGCLVSIGAGLLAVWHYTSTYQETVSGRQGAILGFWAGAAAMLIGSILSGLLKWTGLMPDVPAQMHYNVPSFALHWSFQILVYLFTVVIYALLGLIGGVIGAALFKKGSAYQHASTESDFI
ncbi:MAG: hypothetical protein Q9M35_05810 [Rhodothermus sp.]|nr:hypothetical protein [Rhodothermus sp.]